MLLLEPCHSHLYPIHEDMSEKTSDTSATTERVAISCPGCGRNDRVSWPVGQETFHWKCFNCSKEFDLERGGKH